MQMFQRGSIGGRGTRRYMVMDWVRDGEGLTSEEQLLWWWMWELLCGEEDQLRNVVLVIFLSIGNQGY